MYYITVEDRFSSAHQLNGYMGKCENIHGHNWKVQATVCGEKLNNIGLLIDFKVLKVFLKEITESLDHINLNQHEYFRENNPSTENIARYIFSELKNKLSGEHKETAEVFSVAVWESETSKCEYKEK